MGCQSLAISLPWCCQPWQTNKFKLFLWLWFCDTKKVHSLYSLYFPRNDLKKLEECWRTYHASHQLKGLVFSTKVGFFGKYMDVGWSDSKKYQHHHHSAEPLCSCKASSNVSPNPNGTKRGKGRCFSTSTRLPTRNSTWDLRSYILRQRTMLGEAQDA